jgi:hypothetical protein
MEWLSQNWIWIALAIGGYFLLNCMGLGGYGMGRSTGGSHGIASEGPPAVRGAGSGPAAFDPVSRRA